MPTRLLLAAAIALVLSPGRSTAQSVRGSIVDPGTAAPLTGVVVLLVNTAGHTVARALTDGRGEYRLAAGESGMYRVRSLRIGFLPATTEEFLLMLGQETMRAPLGGGAAISLETIRVVGRNACRAVLDSTAQPYRVWEQARTALTATQVTARIRAIRATMVEHTRVLDPDGRRVRRQTSRITTGLVSQPWKSLSADSLRKGGYVTQALDGSTTYYAPDLDVLLSDSFIEDHCFRIAAASSADRVGIEFEPTRERRGVAEIRGVLWLDRRSSELRRLEYHYVNVSREQASGGAGGDMEFARMASGGWVIPRWNIRMPELETRYVAASGIRSRAQIPEQVLHQIRVESGDLSLVTHDGDTLWASPARSITGRVLDSISGRGISDALITFRGTSLAAVTDSAGAFRISGVLPGEYTMDVQTDTLAALGVTYAVPLTFTRDSTYSLRMPSLEHVIATQCGATVATGVLPGMVGGIVRAGATGDAAPGADIVVEWTALVAREGGGHENRMLWRTARTSASGRFRVCDLPLEVALTLRAIAGRGGAAETELRIPSGGRLALADLMLEARAADDAVFGGTVLSDINGQPLADVEVALLELSKNAFTNERGEFRIGGIRAGVHSIVVRRIGYKLLSDSVTLVANQTVERSMLLSRVVALDTVTVKASNVLRDFDEHRRLGLGHFFTRAELQKMEGRRMSDVLAQVPGITIMSGRANYAAIATSRGTKSLSAVPPSDPSRGLRPACYSQVYLDNALFYRGQEGGIAIFDINSISPSQIEAIEYYAGPSQTPMKYSGLNSPCGVLVIHTRRTP